jgi:nucleoside 2-deoxyribosyltransferase
MVIALLDRSQVDDRPAWEIGYFYAKKSPELKIIGIRTDSRRARESEDAVVNAMIEYKPMNADKLEGKTKSENLPFASIGRRQTLGLSACPSTLRLITFTSIYSQCCTNPDT